MKAKLSLTLDEGLVAFVDKEPGATRSEKIESVLRRYRDVQRDLRLREARPRRSTRPTTIGSKPRRGGGSCRRPCRENPARRHLDGHVPGVPEAAARFSHLHRSDQRPAAGHPRGADHDTSRPPTSGPAEGHGGHRPSRRSASRNARPWVRCTSPHLKSRIGRLPPSAWPRIEAGLCRVMGLPSNLTDG